MGEVTDLSARRWQHVTEAAKHSPVEALKAAIRDIEAGLETKHVIIVMATEGNTSFYQAGSYDFHARLGLLERGKQIVAEA